MLILKGNFIKDRSRLALRTAPSAALWTMLRDVLRATWLASLLASLAAVVPAAVAGPPPAAPAGAAAHAAVRAPEVVAAEFYGWYLETLAADQDPLSDRHERFTAYVARPLVELLLQRLQARAGSLSAAPDVRASLDGLAGGAPAGAAPDRGDYFLQSDRIEGAWLRSRVRAITVRQQARAAHVLVTLAGDDGAKHDLLLTMVLEGDTWKIRHVNRASVDASESSPDRPII